MPEPLNAPESPAMSHAAPSVVSAIEVRERRRQASAIAAYVWPSACERCVPVVRLVSEAYFLTISEAAHERGCPNHPTKRIQSLSKESTTKW